MRCIYTCTVRDVMRPGKSEAEVEAEARWYEAKAEAT